MNGNKCTVNVSITGMSYVVERRKFKNSLGKKRVYRYNNYVDVK
jgi:hypothetical protein